MTANNTKKHIRENSMSSNRRIVKNVNRDFWHFDLAIFALLVFSMGIQTEANANAGATARAPMPRKVVKKLKKTYKVKRKAISKVNEKAKFEDLDKTKQNSKARNWLPGLNCKSYARVSHVSVRCSDPEDLQKSATWEIPAPLDHMAVGDKPFVSKVENAKFGYELWSIDRASKGGLSNFRSFEVKPAYENFKGSIIANTHVNYYDQEGKPTIPNPETGSFDRSAGMYGRGK